jgi:hypothetical protein
MAMIGITAIGAIITIGATIIGVTAMTGSAGNTTSRGGLTGPLSSPFAMTQGLFFREDARRFILSLEEAQQIMFPRTLMLEFVLSECGLAKGTTMDLVPYSREYWLAHAEEAHALAGLMKEPQTKRSMLCVARCYEKLAGHAQEQASLRAQIKIPEGKPE